MAGLRPVLFLLVCLAAGVARGQVPDAASKFRLAQGLELSGDLERAAQLYGELFGKDSSNVLYAEGLQRTAIQLKRYDEAISVIRRRLARTPGDVGLRAMLGSVLYKAGREPEASNEWDEVIAQGPSNPTLYRVVANALIENRLLDKAAEIYRRGRSACGDPNQFSVELAQLLIASMDYGGATSELLRWLSVNPGQVGFVENRMAGFSAKPEARAASIEIVRAAIAKNDDARLDELLAWLYLEGKEFEPALNLYRKIDALSGLHGAGIYAFAERAFREKAFDVAARAYREAIDAHLPPARLAAAEFGYANALMELSILSDTLHGPSGSFPASESTPRYGGAIASFRKVIEEHPRTEYSAKSYYQIGTIQFQRFFDLDGALDSFRHAGDEVAAVGILRYEVALRVAEVLTAKGDSTHAAQQLTIVAGAPDATPEQIDQANFRLAELEYFNGRFQEASRRLDSLAANLSADFANDALELQAFLQENMNTSPQALAEFAHADFLARQHRNTEAIQLFRDVSTKYAHSLLVDDALMKIGALLSTIGLYDDALAAYEKLLAEYRESSTSLDRAQFRIAEIYQFGLKDKTKAVAAYEQLLAGYPRSILIDQARRRIRSLRGDSL